MESYKNNLRESNNTLEKQQKLTASRNEVNYIVDKLGLHVDEGIKDTVAVLRAMDFPTSSSCSGHTEEDDYSPPYVEICTNAPENWKEDKAKQAIWIEENLKYRNKLLPFIEQFYKERNVPLDVKLDIHDMGIFGGFRIENNGIHMKSMIANFKSRDEVIEKIKLYQKEMNDFTEYLRSTYCHQ